MSISDLTNKYGESLVERNLGGIYVALFYDREALKDGDVGETYVFYCDEKSGVSFTLNPPKFLALDAYNHPIVYADAALRGIENPRRLVPVSLEMVAA